MKLPVSTLATATLLAASVVMGDLSRIPNATATPPATRVAFLAETPSPPPTGYDQCTARADGMDLPGNDIGSRQTGDSNACFDYCLWDLTCKAWTWSAGTCWLKGGVGHAVFNAGAYSGVKRSCYDKPNSLFLVVDNCDIRGNDRESRWGASYKDCIPYATSSFTWSDYNGGTCWFKTAVAPCEYAPGKYTGVLIY